MLNVKALSILIIFVLVLSGCNNSKTNFTEQLGRFEEESVEVINEWQEIKEGVYYKNTLFNAVEDNENIHVFKIDPNTTQWTVHYNSENPTFISDWANEFGSLITINGGYFDENYESTGGLKINDNVIRPIVSDGENGYTGALLIDNGIPMISYLPTADLREESYDTIIQTYPTLILPGGKAGVKEDSGKLARRTILAQSEDGNIYILVIGNSNFSLYRIMNELMNSDLSINVAINMDGGPSSGIYVNQAENEIVLPSSILPEVIMID